MDAKLLKEQIAVLGLTLKSRGVITDGMAEYGMISGDELVSTRGARVKIEKIDHLEYNESFGVMKVVLSDESSKDFDAGFMDKGMVKETLSKPRTPPSLTSRSRAQPSPAPRSVNDPSSAGLMKCPKTTSSLNALFEAIYPDWSEQMYYDELSESEVIDMAMLDKSEMGLRHVDDNIMALYHENIEVRLKSMGFDVSRPPGVSVKDEVFMIRMMSNTRNIFREWVEGLEWDGEHRIDTLFTKLFGGTSVILEGEDDARYLAAVARAWLLGAIARMYKPTQHDIVPIFIGGQGAGKTRALKYLAGRDEWYRSTSMQMSAKELPRFLDSVRGGIIVELGEATQLENTSPEMVKQFISQDSDHIRKAYARREQVFPRHFIMAATTNRTEVFTDPTGNRRFFPIMCRPERQLMIFSVEDRSVGGYEVEQIWAEALEMYRSGVTPNLSREETMLAEKVQDFYTRYSPHAQSVDEWLDDPANGLIKVGSRISREGLMHAMFNDPEEGSQMWKSAESMISKWAESTRAWVKCRPFREFRVPESKNYRGWTRTIPPNADIQRVTFAMVSSGKSDREMQWAKDVVDFRRIAIEYDLHPDDTIPETCMSDQNKVYFAKLGFLTEIMVPGVGNVYRVAWIP